MRTNFFKHIKLFFSIVAISLISFGCERDESDLQPATFPNNPEVFIDGFSPGLNYGSFGGAVPTAFDVDTEVTFNKSAASMKIEVPDVNDPRGAYAGGVFFTSVGRDLSEYDALTFWAKASQPASIDIVGFGNDFGESKNQVSVSGLNLNTNWKKYILPIPDPSKFKEERGMFFYSEGPENERGYTFWFDEVKFEKLGTIAHGQSAILNGEDRVETGFIGVNKTIDGLLSIFNMPNGINQAVSITSSQFEFSSSDPSVATVDETGRVTVIGAGSATIRATLGGVQSNGSLTINSLGAFSPAPVPTRDPANVISIFSDVYPNHPVNYYNGYWAPWQTTVSNDFSVNGDNILNYNIFNFVGIEFSNPPVNATTMTHLHMDVYFPGPIAPGRQLRVIVVDFGADRAFGGGDDTRHSTTFTAPTLMSQKWIPINIPFSTLTMLGSRANLAQIILEGGDNSDLYVDNIYFYR
ncbi:MAG: Ig-like domain-containing protein [Saprospiraceae bacterium]|nr:Ig-like domain-containing protein [Saprospiraceae bacterium]